MDKKKILIISMTAGFGHLKAGEALLSYAKESLPSLEALHVDIAEIDPSFKKHSKIYDIISKKYPLIWGVGYAVFNVRLVALVFQKINKFSYIFHGSIKKYILEKKPDIILFTNVTPLPLFASFFSKTFSKIKVGVVITDYHGNAYYNFSFIDHYFVANEKVKQDLVHAGVKEEKIIISGIPISPAFFEKQNVQELKEKYGITNDAPTALLVASFRISKEDLLSLVKKLLALNPLINVVVIANNNQIFYNFIKNNLASEKRLHLVLWTNTMHEYMKLSDVIVTKAGGLTVSECLFLKKPMIMLNPILGQEEHNARFVEDNNHGKWVKDIDEVIKVLPEMISASKNRQMDLIEQENPCKKIFNELI